jgi:hypothetical protein
VVLIIDDAHQMPVETLASVLWLSEVQTSQGEPLLPTILVGLRNYRRRCICPNSPPCSNGRWCR